MSRGGIGSSELPGGPAAEFAATEVEEQPGQRKVPRWEAPDITELRDDLATLRVEMGEQRASLDALRALHQGAMDIVRNLVDETERLDSNHTAIEGTVAQHWTGTQTINNGLITLDARLNALARQVMRHDRIAALNAAATARQPGESHERVVAAAALYLTFIEPPQESQGDEQDIAGNAAEADLGRPN